MNIIIYFWDIQNCPVPANHNLPDVIQKIREYATDTVSSQTLQLTEWGFYVFEDVGKITRERRIQFHDRNVLLVDVPSQKPNAADLVMIQAIETTMQKYMNLENVQFTYVIITGDSDFFKAINKLKNNGITVRLICNFQTKIEMQKEANDSIFFQDLVADGSDCASEKTSQNSIPLAHVSISSPGDSLFEKLKEGQVGSFAKHILVKKNKSDPDLNIKKLTGSHEDILDRL